MNQHSVVSKDAWLEARKALLAKEKKFTHLKDELSAERRNLPWTKVEKNYVFDDVGGSVTLSDLFAGRSQLFIKHFMMGPGVQHQCVGCSLEVDHVDGILPHLEHNDVTYVAVARAPIAEIEQVRRKMGWQFRWVSSFHSDFNYDFGVSFKRDDVESGTALYNFSAAPPWAAGLEDLSGDSVFYKDESGVIFHTYSTYGRGGEQFLGIYNFFDVVPKGRNENGPYHSMGDWVRPKNMYDTPGTLEPNGRFHTPTCTCSLHTSEK